MKAPSSIPVKPAPRCEADTDTPANLPPRARPVGKYPPAKRSFTLVEMMVSMALLVILAYVLLQVTGLVAVTNARVNGGVNSFQDASIAFDTLTKTLSQATLNTYIDYYPSQLGANSTLMNNQNSGIAAPSIYIRQSELHFVCGQATNLVMPGLTTNTVYPTHAVFFQAPLGYSIIATTNSSMPPTPDLLNVCGFYIAFGTNYWVPSFLTSANATSVYRYRLMEVLQPTENMAVYSDPALSSTNTGSILPSSYDTGNTYSWITNATAVNSRSGMPIYARPLADNIVLLVIQPMLASADQAAYVAQNITFPTTNSPSNNLTNFDYSYDTRRDPISTNSTPYQQLEQNQLPPLIQVTMVAIDEPSAIRLVAQYATSPGNANLISGAQTFGADKTLFTQTASYAADLKQYTAYLSSIHVNYRVFTAQVPMFNAKWTTQ